MNRHPNNESTAKPIPPDVSEPKPNRSRGSNALLSEIAWEAVNQIGGIYTVLRSKVPAMMKRWGDRYCLIGPLDESTASIEFDPAPTKGPFGEAAEQLNQAGIDVRFGRWLVTGRPQAVLINHHSVQSRIHEIKYRLWKDHDISLPADDELVNNICAFGEVVRIYLQTLARNVAGARRLIAHFHEWMAGTAIPHLRQEQWPGSIVFTTHATLLGRYLAMNDPQFYDHLPHYNADEEAKTFNVEAQNRIERAAAHGAHVFTTVSDVTADECRHLIGRDVDLLLPNGLNIQRFERLHQLQLLHREHKEKIHEFTMGHFFPSYTFDLDKTLYFFTSGRYEYRNKGMDLTIEALARLNHALKMTQSETTVVAFIVTKRPFRNINVQALKTRAMLDEFQNIADKIKVQIGRGLFNEAARGKIPDLNTLFEDYWRLRLRRSIQAWKSSMPPGIVTHDLEDDTHDEVLNQLRHCHLWNDRYDRVKVIYHPDFINPTNPLWSMDYDQFVRGCHMGIFPSYYEPWGYTPLEAMASGVVAVSSDLAGFGSYVRQILPEHGSKGLHVIDRRFRSFDNAAEQLAETMFNFCLLTRRERITQRHTVENFATHFDWHNLGERYHEAHELALERVG